MADLIRFWGVRGSIPSPGAATALVGGNTSCVEVMLGGERIIIDGGTGLRELGVRHGRRPLRATVLFGHLHWDHVQGFPFLAPLHDPQSSVTLVGPAGLEAVLRRQMTAPSFPVALERLAATLRFVELLPGETLDVGSVRVETAGLNHPGGAIGYRLVHEGCAVAYLCDNEHVDPWPSSELVDLCRGVELAVIDAQYLPDEYPARRGWGHSTYEKAAELASAAGARRLVLSHHDPERSDVEVARIERAARRLFPATRAAREGMTVRLHRARERSWVPGPATRTAA